MLACYFADSAESDILTIAQQSARVKPLSLNLAKSGVLLISTCVRLEIYGEEEAIRDVAGPIFLGLPCKRIAGADNIAIRLAEIASGAHSQIFGEGYISDQLEKAIEPLGPHFNIFNIGKAAIKIGRAARERQGFKASLDYDEIVREFVAARFPNGEQCDRLYVVGSGMLGQGLIRSSVRGRFRGTVVVTRDPKNFRRRTRSLDHKEVALLRPAEIGHRIEPLSMAIIATADVQREYKTSIYDALLRLQPRAVVDLSSIPLLSSAEIGKLSYVTIYDQEFLQYIAKNNKALAPKRPLLLSDIRTAIETVQFEGAH
ncbi:Glutamyl-tRNA reductase [Neorhizobium galegae bv. officinalis]|nr:Glutamyl-tRNA reductase [Neorhizobium galegae bv. officinalis]